MADFNGDWFRRKLVEKGRSQRQLAKHLDRNASAVTLLLAGQRRMQMSEAELVASFLGEPLHDVLRAAGLPIKENRKCRIIGIWDGSKLRHVDGLGAIDISSSMPSSTVAANVEINGAEIDGGIVIFQAKK